MRKILKSLAFVAASLMAQAALGQVTYTYTGKPFTFFTCGFAAGSTSITTFCPPPPDPALSSYITGNSVSATLTLTSALGPNLTSVDVRTLPGFQLTMSDGQQTKTASSVFIPIAKISTDNAGNIIAPWQLLIGCQWPCNLEILTENAFSQYDGGSLTSAASAPINGAAITNSPGTWGAGGGPPPSGFATGAFTRVTQCCDGVDNVDLITGDVSLETAYSIGGSTLGYNIGYGHFTPITINGTTVTNNGPAAGAFSNSNQGAGFGRGIAFATFTNNTGSDAALNANAVLSGTFYHDSFGLPDGTLRGAAAVHVFDAAAFNTALSNAISSGKTVGQFLLGNPTATAGLDPATDFLDLETALAGAHLGFAPTVYGNGTAPFYPALISANLKAPFTVKATKSFTVVFDVVASAVVGGFGCSYSCGTGQVNLLDTLKPAANLFTDANGNPVTSGIGVVSPFSSLPPAAATLTLGPPTGTAVMENPYTLTATALDGSSNPVVNIAVKFVVKTGPDVGVIGVGLTDAKGKAAFTFKGQGGAGTDTVQASIGSVSSNTVQVTWQAAKCPIGPGYWKNHPAAWPVQAMTLGKQSYNQAQLLNIMNTRRGDNASMLLAFQLIAAKLNVANGADPRPMRVAAAAGDSALSLYSTPLPNGVKPESRTGEAMTESAEALALYNEGELTRACAPKDEDQ